MPWFGPLCFRSRSWWHCVCVCVPGSMTFVLQVIAEATPSLLRLEQVSQGPGLPPSQLLPLLFQAGAEHLGGRGWGRSGARWMGYQEQGQQGVVPVSQVSARENLAGQSRGREERTLNEDRLSHVTCGPRSRAEEMTDDNASRCNAREHMPQAWPSTCVVCSNLRSLIQEQSPCINLLG